MRKNLMLWQKNSANKILVCLCKGQIRKQKSRQTRMIFYLRCAAYLRLLPRTRTQKQRAQTHSRRRAMLAAVTKINLPSCLGFCSQICPIYLMAPYATCAYNLTVIQLFVAHAVRRVNSWLFHCVNTENEASCQGKRLSKRPSFTSFCASGNDLFFRRGNERDENDVKRG